MCLQLWKSWHDCTGKMVMLTTVREDSQCSTVLCTYYENTNESEMTTRLFCVAYARHVLHLYFLLLFFSHCFCSTPFTCFALVRSCLTSWYHVFWAFEYILALRLHFNQCVPFDWNPLDSTFRSGFGCAEEQGSALIHLLDVLFVSDSTSKHEYRAEFYKMSHKYVCFEVGEVLVRLQKIWETFVSLDEIILWLPFHFFSANQFLYVTY